MTETYDPLPRFNSKFTRGSAEECWNWKGKVNTFNGYAYFWIAGNIQNSIRAHRFAYETANNVKLTQDIYVLHKCDNRACVNPNHLFTGDARDNAHDAMSKGRHLHGEKHHKAKLTEKDVLYIREYLSHGRYRPGGMLARQFGVSRTVISHIKKRTIWKHI